MRLYDEVTSEEDFELLPPVVQRKYFSSLERLRLAQNGPCTDHGTSSSSRRPSTSNGSFLRSQSVSHPPTRSDSLFRSKSGRRRLHKRPRTTTPPPTSTLPSPAEFATLPLAIQQKYFTVEEQYYIASRFNPVVLDAADELFYKNKHKQQSTTISIQVRQLDEFKEFDFGFGRPQGGVAEQAEHRMDLKELQDYQWLGEGDGLDLKLDYHKATADLASASSAYQRHVMRRDRESSETTRLRSVTSSTKWRASGMSSLTRSTSHSAMPQTGKHNSHDSVASIDKSALHYQDPAAKMKLRVYLTSPQKFDEAVEFGFPALQEQHMALTMGGSGSLFDDRRNTMLSDDTPSLTEDDKDEQSDLPYYDSPRTPREAWLPGHRPSHKSSLDRSQFRPRLVAHAAGKYMHASAEDREMTLRMTLTKPALSNLEENQSALSGKQIYVAPLDRPSLHTAAITKESVWDTLPEEPSKVKRFFKKFTS